MGDIAKVTMRASAWPEDLTLDDYARMLRTYGWNGMPFGFTMNPEREEIESDFLGLTVGAYRANSVVFACLLTRFSLFSQARFAFQQLRNGQPGDLFGTADLRILEAPEPGVTTADMLRQGILDADLAGDWFGARRPGPTIKRLRPDWTTIVLGSPNRYDNPAFDPDCKVAGYMFSPGGPFDSAADPSFYLPEEVAHFAPIPDPFNHYRGMSIITAAVRDIRGDSAATSHKLKFFELAATPNLVVKFPPSMKKPEAEKAIALFEQEHAGVANAYRTAYLLGGADIQAVGKDLKELDFAAVQGKDETRIVAALGLHPSLVPVSEGLQGSTLNAGNFGQARRMIADKTLRPNWGDFAASLQTIVPALPGSRLWFDERHIPFLAEDIKDAADVMFQQAQAMRTLGDGGWNPDTVVDAVTSGDLRRLTHTGMLPVQLQPPGNGNNQATYAALFRAFFEEQQRAMAPRLTAPRSTELVVAITTFWPTASDLPLQTIQQGTPLPADAELVSRYPSLFAPVEDRSSAA